MGRAKVFAVDVNMDQLDWKLRKDPRVTIECNARYLKAEEIPERPDFVTADVSFISVTKILPALVPVARAGADFLILVKPQFELERSEIGKGGIVRDAALHEKAIERVQAAAAAWDWRFWVFVRAACRGPKAIRSFFSTRGARVE